MENCNKMLDKTYNPKIFEKEVYENTEKFFNPDESISDENRYVIMMPPPNVTGSLHLGHALTYTLQDILIRYHRQNGKKTLWQPGMDHAGIATQMVVERMLEKEGIHRSDISREEFIEKVWKWKAESGGTIEKQQRALGCSAAWDYSRFTMDEGFSEAVTGVFVELYKKNLLYRAKRLVNWDTKFKTAISDLEIQNKEEKGMLWHIKYKIEESEDFIVIATTRPETMFGDVAVAVHPEDERYKSIVGKFVEIPYTDRKIPVITDEHADMEKGSGCVKITPAHDYNDFAVGERHDLPHVIILDENGHMESNEYVVDFLKGLYIKKARKVLLERLNQDGLIVREEEIIHSVPYGDRSGVIIEPMLKDQWFVDAKILAKEAIKVVEDGSVKFYPEKWENTYFDWMNNIQPWCVSRQITWGHQIPAWYGPSGEIIVEKTEHEAIETAKKMGLTNNQIRRDEDVLDTWFSSGLWTFGTLGWPKQNDMLKKYHPTDVLVTGFDIIFFWVARMMMMSLHCMNEIPFKDIYVHALVRDEKGQKMSKSKGNVIDPMDLMNEFGADALRFTLAFFCVPGRDIKIGKDVVKTSRNFITKIWNAARFLQYREVSFSCGLDEIKPTSDLNKWVITKLKRFQTEIDQNVKEYRFDYMAKNIQVFLREVFCDFFVEAMKVVDDEETKNTAGAVFREFLRISHPVIPFVTDYLSKTLGMDDTLIISSRENLECFELFNESEEKVDELLNLIHVARSEKQENGEESENYQSILSKIDSFQEDLKILSKLI